MRRRLDTRDGLIRYAISSIEDLDLPAVVAMMAEAWQADYSDQVRPDFNEAFLRRMMVDPSTWVGVLVCTDAGTPVGMELALERTLYCRQIPLRAYYATVFTVSSQHRRRGIGRWLLEGINQLAFEERQADLIFSTFHHGHAGSPTVQSTYDQIPDWSVNRFYSTPIWSRRLDREPLPAPSEPISVAAVVRTDDETEWTLRPDDSATAHVVLPSVAEFTQTIRTQYDVAFGLDASFRTQYLRPDASDSGTMWYDFGSGATCCVSYFMTPLIVNDRPLRRAGLIQSLHPGHCTPDHLERVLLHLAHVFLQHDCFAVSLYDIGVIPTELLQRLGFHASEDRYAYAVRGPDPEIAPFATVKPPFFIDFT